MALTTREAQTVAHADVDRADAIHGAMVEACKLEYGGRWTPEHGWQLLEARLELDAQVEDALARHALRAGAGA